MPTKRTFAARALEIVRHIDKGKAACAIRILYYAVAVLSLTAPTVQFASAQPRTAAQESDLYLKRKKAPQAPEALAVEIGRVPFNQESFIGCALIDPGNSLGDCTLTFPVVPLHQRLEITTINCPLFALPGFVPSASSNITAVRSGGASGPSAALVPVQIGFSDNANIRYFVVNQPLLLIAPAGSTPTVTMSYRDDRLESYGCTLMGYRVYLK